MKYLLITLLLLIAQLSGSCQKEYFAEHITFQNGDPISGVTDIIQDGNDLIWMGGSNGLHVYDGYFITTYAKANGDIQANIGSINRLKINKDGLLYLEDGEGLIKVFNPTTRQLIPEKQMIISNANRIQDFEVVDQNLFTLEETEFQAYVFSIWMNGKKDTLSTFYAYGGIRLFLDNGQVYVPQSNAITTYSSKNGSIIKNYKLKDQNTLVNPGNITKDKEGNLYVQSACLKTNKTPESCNIFKKKKDGDEFELISRIKDVDLENMAYIMASNNDIWIGGEQTRLTIINEKEQSSFSLEAILQNANQDLESYPIQGYTRCIMQDRSDVIWQSNRAGVVKISSRQLPLFEHILSPQNSLCGGNCFIIAITVDTDGKVYFIVQGKSIALYSYNPNTKLTHQICEFASANSKGSGLYIRENMAYWNRYAVDLLSGDIRTLFESNEPEISLVPNYKNGFDYYCNYPSTYKIAGYRYSIDEDQSTQFSISDSLYLSNNILHNILLDPKDESHWVSTATQGLFHFSKEHQLLKHFKKENTSSSLPSDRIHDLQFIEDDLWVAHNKGVSIINVGSGEIISNIDVKLENHANHLTSTPFYTIWRDDSLVWFSTSKGLFYYDLESDSIISLRDVPGIGRANFLLGTKAQDKITKRLYFGTPNGMYSFLPKDILNYTHSEPKGNLIITKYVKWDGLKEQEIAIDFPMSKADHIDVKYVDRYYSFEYTYTNYQSQDRKLYSTYMEGWDDQWSLKTVSPRVRYNTLPAGNYKFKVRAYVNGHIVDEISYPIQVYEAWFRTLWFRLGLLIISVVGVGYIFSIRGSRKLKRQEEMDSLRTKISSDLHDDVGTMLSGLSMQADVMKYKASDDDKKLLAQISQTSRDAMDRMRDTVWAIDSRQDKYISLLDRMREYAEKTLDQTDIDYKIASQGLSVDEKILPNHRQELYLIFKEALTNIMKHAQATEVSVRLEKFKNEIIFTLRDNGIGTNTGGNRLESTGQGLENIKMRVKRINGTVTFKNNDGFCIKIVIPLN